MGLERISAVIIPRDAGETMAATPASLSGFPDVAVDDNGSTDDTVALAIAWSDAKGVFYKYMRPYARSQIKRKRSPDGD